MIDLLNQRFGRLRVTGLYHKTNSTGTDEIFWTCVCDCGGARDVRGFSLRSGETSSCGCLRLESRRAARKKILTGLVFGRLTVGARIKRQNPRTGKNTFLYACACTCGNIREVQSSHLRAGSTKSCGCLLREMKPATKYLPGAHFVLKDYKRSAKTRNLEWGLTDEAAKLLIEAACFYCGLPPQRVVTPPDREIPVEFSFNGIDRKNSELGYIDGNVVPCCTQCNYAKRNYTDTEFIEMCRRVTEHQSLEVCYTIVSN